MLLIDHLGTAASRPEYLYIFDNINTMHMQVLARTPSDTVSLHLHSDTSAEVDGWKGVQKLIARLAKA